MALDPAMQPMIDQGETMNTSARPRWLEQMEAFTGSKSFRQLSAMIALAAVISFMVGFFMWSRTPGLEPLYANLSGADAAQVADALRAANKPFQIDPQTGAIMVGRDQIHETRLLLASQGLPQSGTVGLEMLQKDQALGTSQFIETARYHHAMENELARTIASLAPVESARVHLALPKQSVFVRNRQPSTASVVVKLYPGRMLEPGQVASIVHLVSASVAGMHAKDVTVVDQQGRLLSEDAASSGGVGLNGKQFDFRQRVEQDYIRRIEDLLQPLVGVGKVRAQVSADLDFSEREGTQELYGPKDGVLRSEQLSEQDTRVAGQWNFNGGVPGALTNQPPGGGTTNPGAVPPNFPQNMTPEQYERILQLPANGNKNQTRNFEVDKQISHTRFASGELKRLSVAVVVDDKVSTNEAGETVRTPLNDAEIEKLNALIKEAVGFDEARGDRVTVTNVAFVGGELEVPSIPLWEQPWVWELAKQIGIGMALLLIFLFLVRPLLGVLFPKPPKPAKGEDLAALPGGMVMGADGQPLPALPGGVGMGGAYVGADGMMIPGSEGMHHLMGGEDDLGELPKLLQDASYTTKLEQLRREIERDPRVVATVIKHWTRDDER